jgi:6-phosphogluconolactonase/glucosamine-6-phosphate isomerase/deaminase
MAQVDLRILESPAAVAAARAGDLRRELQQKPDLVFIANAGATPIETYRQFAAQGLDLSHVHLRLLDSYLASPSRGFTAPDHPGCFTRFVVENILGVLDEERRPRDWVMLPEDVTSCEEVEAAMAEQPDAWNRLRHPVTGEPGAEIAIRDLAEGALDLVRRVCDAYERLLMNEDLDVVSLGVGPMPYPHLAFNTGPYTRPDAVTHLSLLDEATRVANAQPFGGPESVPPYALTTGPATLMRARTLWVTALGAGKSEPLAWGLGDPRSQDFAFRSSLGYVLRASQVSIVVDEAAGADLCADSGLEGLAARYAEAGHALKARRA